MQSLLLKERDLAIQRENDRIAREAREKKDAEELERKERERIEADNKITGFLKGTAGEDIKAGDIVAVDKKTGYFRKAINSDVK